MAAPATLTSATSLEGQSVELMRELQQAEDAYIAAGLALEPPVNRARRLTVAINTITGVATYSFSVPITVADAANGYAIAAATYLP